MGRQHLLHEPVVGAGREGVDRVAAHERDPLRVQELRPQRLEPQGGGEARPAERPTISPNARTRPSPAAWLARTAPPITDWKRARSG